MKHLSCLGNVQAKIKTKAMVICFITILLCSVASVPVRAGSDNAGMLFPNGTVTVNGVQTSAPIAVFPGDKIETGNSVVALATNGKVSFVDKKSSIVFKGEAASSSNSKLGHKFEREGHRKHHSPHQPCKGRGGEEDEGHGENGNCDED